MSKSSQSTNFRAVDIDELDEERYQDDANDVPTQIGPDENEIQNLLNVKKTAEALKLLLEQPPFNAGAPEKARVFQLMVRVLSQTKSTEIDNIVQQLSQTQVDTLLKYIYKGFNEPTDSLCGVLLNWHEKVFAATGLGGIMRVMTSRTSV